MVVNHAELERVWGWIQAHPENYEQCTWGHIVADDDQEVSYDEWNDYWGRYTSTIPVCRTSMCIAGVAAVLNGWRLMFGEEDDTYADTCVRGSVLRGIPDVAAEVLGLSYSDTTKLFYAYNSVEEMEKMIKHLKENGSLNTYPHLFVG